jgi:hypothetical protein
MDDEMKHLLNGIKEAVELNNAKIQSLEKNLNDFRKETKEELQQINERLDSLDAGQELLVKRLFRNEREVARLKHIK